MSDLTAEQLSQLVERLTDEVDDAVQTITLEEALEGYQRVGEHCATMAAAVRDDIGRLAQ